MKYTLRDNMGSRTVVAVDSLKEARKAARNWVRGGDWGGLESTSWVQCRIYDNSGDCVEAITVAVDPEEPDCTDKTDHDWDSPYDIVGGIKENPGVWGHGGGVIIHEVCCRCGLHRRRDTWAQNPETGEQGLQSVEYYTGEGEED